MNVRSEFTKPLLPRRNGPPAEGSWGWRIQQLRNDPRIKSYTTIARLLGVNQVSVMRWAKGMHEPLWPFREAIERLEQDGYGVK